MVFSTNAQILCTWPLSLAIKGSIAASQLGANVHEYESPLMIRETSL